MKGTGTQNLPMLQTVRRSVPYTENRQVCSQTELWHVTTPTVYPWSPTIPLFVVRGANLDYCADLSVEEVTEEDLEICEVVCQPTTVKECAKVSQWPRSFSNHLDCLSNDIDL